MFLLLCPAVGIAGSPTLGTTHRASGPPAVLPGDRDGWWDEPPDLNGWAMTSEIISALGVETETANDFYSSSSTTIYEAVWWGEYYIGEGEPNVTAFNLRFYADAGGVPGSLMAEYLEIYPDGDDRSRAGPRGTGLRVPCVRVGQCRRGIILVLGSSVRPCVPAAMGSSLRGAGDRLPSYVSFRVLLGTRTGLRVSKSGVSPWTRVSGSIQLLRFPERAASPICIASPSCQGIAFNSGGHARGPGAPVTRILARPFRWHAVSPMGTASHCLRLPVIKEGDHRASV